ncbi:MAG: rod-binding protein [Pseudomonadales bacterium]|nr:rod-binding protein [Pseudomonadales bacterium]
MNMNPLNSQFTLDSQFALDMQGVQRLRQSAQRDPEGAKVELGKQFEALFLQTMLKSMRDAIPQSGLLDSQQTRFYQSLMDQQWAQHLAGQGFGLAEQISKQLSGTGSGG